MSTMLGHGCPGGEGVQAGCKSSTAGRKGDCGRKGMDLTLDCLPWVGHSIIVCLHLLICTVRVMISLPWMLKD